MKTLTTFAAVAALIAGISVASAQSSSMDKSGAMGSSSIHATGTGKFCVKGISGALNCQYASLSACQKAAKGSETCQARPSSTTGSKN
jgi:hypothetical protein